MFCFLFKISFRFFTVVTLPYIEQCNPQSSCTLYQEPFTRTFLTCTALLVSPEMSLKWYNGTTEMTDNVKVTSGKTTLNKTFISSKVTIKHDIASFLTCQAAGVRLDKTFAHVQLETKPGTIPFCILYSLHEGQSFTCLNI